MTNLLWMTTTEPEERKERFKGVYGDKLILEDLGDDGGDFRFIMEIDPFATVGIEHKTLTGLLSDMSTNRVVEQLHGLREKVDIPVLLIMGWAGVSFPGNKLKTKLGTTERSYFYLENWLLSRAHEGIVIYRYPAEGQEVKVIQEIIDWYNNPEHRSGWSPLKFRLPVEERDPKLEMICSFPDVGIDRGRAVLQAYPKLIDFFTQSFPLLKGAIEGVGPKTIEKVFQTLGRDLRDKGYYIRVEPGDEVRYLKYTK